MSAESTLAAFSCTSLSLEFEVDTDKFDANRFVETMKKRKRGAVICRTASPDKIDYHVHMEWAVRDKKVNISVNYYTPGMPPQEDEKEPYAESVVTWLGQFFLNETAHASLGAYFRYNQGSRLSRFPLPIKLGVVPDLDMEIDGVSFSLPSKPNGVEGLLIMHESDSGLSVQVRGSTRVDLKNFGPISAIETLSAVVLRFTDKKPNAGETP